MRSNNNYSRRSRWPQFLIGSLLTVLLITGGVVATLSLLGVNLNPFAKPEDDPFMVRIPINAKPIPAYSRVDRNQLVNPATGGLMFQKVPPNSTIGMSIIGIDANGSHVEGAIQGVKRVQDEVVFDVSGGHEIRHGKTIDIGGAKININDIIGRVVKKDKRAGLGFRDDTFFPIGTPEGIAGATPPGMRAITLDATKLTGVHALNAGDRIDLMASVAEVQSSPTDPNGGNASANNLIGATHAATKGKDNQSTQPFLLAQNALVLKPVYVRNEAESTSSLTQGKRLQNVPKYEVAIAVLVDDVISLQTALHKQLGITCIARSMQPGADVAVAVTTRPDMVRVPVTVRAILAYDVVHRDAFVSAATRTIRMEEISQQQIDRQGILTSLEGVLGSVARHDIPTGSFVRQSDLLNGALQPTTPKIGSRPPQVSDSNFRLQGPDSTRYVATQSPTDQSANTAQPANTATTVGDRTAITRFIPAGRTAFAIPWNRIYGAEHLQIGDSIDLLASFSLESNDDGEETETRPDGTKIVRKRNSIATRKTERTWEDSFGFRGEPWFVASDATVVGPVGFPAPASAMRALGDPAVRAVNNANNMVSAGSGPAVIIAVDARDVESFASALAAKGALFTIAFHAEEDVNRPAPDGMKRIAISPEQIAAYEVFSESRWKGNRRSTSSRMVRIDDPRFETAIAFEDVDRYFDRTIERAKRRGDCFRTEDFLPAAMAGGIAAAARSGYSIFTVADREIEGLDALADDDRVAVLIRGVIKPPVGVVAHGFSLSRPVSSVIVPELRIVRSTIAGQTVLEVKNEDITLLQAALATNLIETQQQSDRRSNLVAIAISSNADFRITERGSNRTVVNIPNFDPLSGMKMTEFIVGQRRETHAYAGSEYSPVNGMMSGVAR